MSILLKLLGLEKNLSKLNREIDYQNIKKLAMSDKRPCQNHLDALLKEKARVENEIEATTELLDTNNVEPMKKPSSTTIS